MTPDIADSLRLMLQVPDTTVTGEQVPMMLRVENVSGRRLDLFLLGREITFDVVVSSASGDTVWRRLEGAVIPMMLRVEPLEPGGRLELPVSWHGRDQTGAIVAPGDYRARGVLLGEGGPLETPWAPLRIVRR